RGEEVLPFGPGFAETTTNERHREEQGHEDANDSRSTRGRRSRGFHKRWLVVGVEQLNASRGVLRGERFIELRRLELNEAAGILSSLQARQVSPNKSVAQQIPNRRQHLRRGGSGHVPSERNECAELVP